MNGGWITTLHCHGTTTDGRGWHKTRDVTADTAPKGLQMDDLGKCYVSRKQGPHPGAWMHLTPFRMDQQEAAVATTMAAAPLQALSIPVIPQPLFSHAGKITVFEPIVMTTTSTNATMAMSDDDNDTIEGYNVVKQLMVVFPHCYIALWGFFGQRGREGEEGDKGEEGKE